MGGRIIKSCAVYAIEHVESGRCYVGGSVSYRSRWNYHRARLGKGTHENGPLQAAWSKCGAAAFRFVVLEVVRDSWNLRAVEQRHLDERRALPAGVFNLFIDANGSKGYKQRAEVVAARATLVRGQKRPDEWKQRASAWMRGNRNGAGKSYCGFLRESDIVPIFEAVASGLTTKDTGAIFHVTAATIGRIIKRRIWVSVLVPPEIVERAQRQVAANRGIATKRRGKLRDRLDEVRARIAAGEPSASIAAECGVTRAAINSIKAGRIWKG